MFSLVTIDNLQKIRPLLLQQTHLYTDTYSDYDIRRIVGQPLENQSAKSRYQSEYQHVSQQRMHPKIADVSIEEFELEYEVMFQYKSFDYCFIKIFISN